MIEVHIPYLPGFNLCEAYNYYMEKAENWVLFIDHDVYLALNPHWYECCEAAIKQVGDTAGIITCRTNRIAERTAAYKTLCQQDTHTLSDDILVHRELALKLWKNYGTKVEELPAFVKNLPGFFMLTNRTAWAEVDGFKPWPDRNVHEKFLGIDNYYSHRILEVGYKNYVIKGLYVYHGYFRDWRKR